MLADDYAVEKFTSDSGQRLLVTGDFVKLADDYAGGGTAGAVYRYLGGNGRVDLGAQDYGNAALWAKVGGEAGAAYRYLGTNATIDLGAVDYGDTSLWQKLAGAAGSVYQYMGTAATLDLGAQDYSDLGYWKPVPATQLIPQGYNVSGSDAMAIGGLVVVNDVRSDVAAYVKDTTVTADALSLAALETAVIRADADYTPFQNQTFNGFLTCLE